MEQKQIKRLNEIGADEVLILFNEYLNGELDEHINYLLQEWNKEQINDFLVFAETRNKNIQVIKNP